MRQITTGGAPGRDPGRWTARRRTVPSDATGTSRWLVVGTRPKNESRTVCLATRTASTTERAGSPPAGGAGGADEEPADDSGTSHRTAGHGSAGSIPEPLPVATEARM